MAAADLKDVSIDPITDAGLEHVAAFGQLERLTLNKTKVTSAGLAHLAKLTKLRRLSLSECEIDDAGLAHLDRLTSLEFLDLGRTKVTDAGMQSLAGLARLKSAAKTTRIAANTACQQVRENLSEDQAPFWQDDVDER